MALDDRLKGAMQRFSLIVDPDVSNVLSEVREGGRGARIGLPRGDGSPCPTFYSSRLRLLAM